MFCKDCGKEVEKEWVVCPNCGSQLKKDKMPKSNFQESKEYNLLGMRRTGRFSFWKIPSTIRVEGEDVHVSIHGKKKTKYQFGKKDITAIDFPILPIWKVSDIIRLVLFGLLMFLSYGLSFFAVLFSIKIAVSRHLRLKLNTGEVISIPICQKADASDFLRELDYPEEEIVKNNAKRISEKKWALKEWVICMLLFILAAATIALGLEMKLSNMQKDEIVEDKINEEEKVSYSDLDIEELIGQSEEILKDTDFTYNEDEIGYQLLDGNVVVDCTDGIINMIMITGNGDGTPSFHGVNLGMSIEEAEGCLADKYENAGEDESRKVYLDLDSRISVGFKEEAGVVTEIIAVQLSEEEIQGYMKEEYIFPDSDKKYLSEDEVRSITAEDMAIGRNEIFARHGYIFQDEGLKAHFESTSWYVGTVQADQFNADAVFNDFEKKNVELIKRVEDEINGENTQPANDFVLSEGTYVNDQILEDTVALVTVSYASVDWMEVHIFPASGYNGLTLWGSKIDDKTIQVKEEYSGIVVTLTWDSSREVTLTSSGTFTGMDSEMFNVLTNAHYVLDSEF